MKYPFLALFTLMCTGCTGSHLVYGPQDAPRGTFPDLHDVPEKPDFPDEDISKPVEEALTSDYTRALAKNDTLRRAAGLDVGSTK